MSNKYIILVRALPQGTPMKDLINSLNKVKDFKNLKTFFNTGNIILDFGDNDNENDQKKNKEIIDKNICNILSNDFNMDNPKLGIFNLNEYKDILSSNPFDELEKTVIFFPTLHSNHLDQTDFDNKQCNVIDGTLYYFGVTYSKNSSDTKVFRLISSKTKVGSKYEYTFRTWNTVQKILSLANK